MEDGSDGLTSTATVLRSPVRNGEIMANFPDVNEEVAPASPVKVNGDTKSEDESDSSDCDALIIDEKPQKAKKPKRRGFKGFKKTTNDSFVHTNPYFAESIFDLLEKSQKRDDKKSSHPKLREYAQYLGLQPTVQFKCSKCSRSGFPSLATLNDHLTQCNDSNSVPVTDTSNVSVSGSTNIRVTRKVFLCSACGTYYENWNLFLHMREVHKRYICLYCLGMFSHPDKLAVHIVSKHNCVPNHVTTLDEFYDLHADPCFLMCCECQRGFTERDNFFDHVCCIETKKTLKSIRQNNKVTTKSKSIEHVTADSVDEIVTTCKDDTRTEEDTATAEVNVDDESKVVTVETEICDNSMSNCDVTQEEIETAVVESEPVEEESVTTMDEVVEESERSDVINTVPEEEDTRKVPKVTLKLPKTFETDDLLVYESDDSEKLTMEVDDDDEVVVNDDEVLPGDLQVAGPDVSIVELELEQPLDKFNIKLLLQKCLQSTIPTCVYCNHARRISVNGKQLGLHAIAEHRFSAIVNSITAEELIPESFVARIRDCLPELENVFFNLEASASEEAVTFSHVFECFQCRYATTIHKELYLHNRKMHAKSILLCIMCKSNFYSYSELICHLCPGLYELDNDVRFRCCMCVSDELPSAFRLMVHLRKRHHVCDVCLEQCHNQSRLSNHVWKHKLHHLCYRCGIAYRNKPDITKHLYWKHGTESVLCKKCLQKKWPHVYHFCILPPTFTCEECNLSFTRAVSLMVHKRLHVNLKPHSCTEPNCTEQFISKKLLLKHEFKHREPPEETTIKTQDDEVIETAAVVPIIENTEQPENGAAEVDDKSKPKVDVYDLPELNLSESDSSDSDDEVPEVKEIKTATVDAEKPVLGTIWDDFRSYQAIKVPDETEPVPSLQVILSDHDYCAAQNASSEEAKEMTSVDHDYCFGAAAVSTKKKTPSSTSSSGSDSSSCTCGSNCSCSSSTSSSSSDSSESDSSTSVGRRRQQERRERRKLKTKSKKPTKDNVAVATTDPQTTVVKLEVPIQESDLETTESDTDEDFYDKQPQKLANKLLAEKKNQLLQLAAIGPYINGSIMDGSRPPTPNLPIEEPSKPKKKSKSKKRKKKNKSSKYESENPNNAAAAVNIPIPAPVQPSLTPHDSQYDSSQNLDDSSLRASKRRRVPNKFYGYSSDEDQDKIPQPPVFKWRKVDLPSPKSPLIVPPITIKSVLTPTPTVDPISIRTTATTGELCVHVPTVSQQQREPEVVSESNDSSSSSEEELQQQQQMPQPPPPVKEQPALYCYCRCPYDEVSEMIGCDASDCAIEWFHFECVGIMVPPKGQWFCPDCRKKKQQRREMLLQNQTRDCLNIN